MARAGVSEQEVVRGRGLGSVAGAGEGGAVLPGTPEGTAGVSARSLNQPAARPSPADGRYVLERERISDTGCCIGSLRGCGWGVQNGLYLVVASGLCPCCWGLWDLGSSLLGLEGVKMGAGRRGKGEDCNKVFPNGLGFGSGGCRGAKGCCGGLQKRRGGILFSGKMV